MRVRYYLLISQAYTLTFTKAPTRKGNNKRNRDLLNQFSELISFEVLILSIKFLNFITNIFVTQRHMQ
jgi:hypothetical protein